MHVEIQCTVYLYSFRYSVPESDGNDGEVGGEGEDREEGQEVVHQQGHQARGGPWGTGRTVLIPILSINIYYL